MVRLSERIQFCLLLLAFFPVSSLPEAENSPIAQSPTKFQVLEADRSYKFKIKNNHQMYFTFDVPSLKQTELTLDIQSSGPFQLCILDQNKQCSSAASTYRKKQNWLKLTGQQLAHGIKVKNPSLLFRLKISLSFHFSKDLCHHLETSRLHRKELSHTNCYSFELNKIDDVVLLIGKEHFMDLSYQFTLCGSNVKNQFKEGQDQFLFKKDYIGQICGSATSIVLSINISDQQHARKQESNTSQGQGSPALVTLALQYSKEPILLPDGIAYRSSQEYFSNGRQTFYFELLNLKNTSINVITHSEIEIYAKVVNQSQKDHSVPSRDNFDFASKSGEILTYFRPYMVITQENFKKFTCEDCFLVVQVFTAAGSTDALTIEITQQMSILEKGKMKHHFLIGGSMAYYEYTPKINTAVTYELADNNKGCAVFYLSTSQLPGPLNSLETSFNNRIIYKSTSNAVYYIGVEAKVDCAYSLVATDSSNEVTSLEKGRFGYLNMAKGQVKYFLIKAETSQYIKLLSLHVYGKVQIYLNRSTTASLKQFNSANVNISSFEMKGQFMNRLILSNSSNLYCSKCYYLVAVVALKVTESTLFYGDEKTPIPIHDKIINDMILQKGQKVAGQYYGELKFELQVKIHSGKLKLKITNGQQTFESLFEEAQVVDTMIVDLGKKKGLLQIIFSLFDFDPVTVVFEALEDNTVYSVRFIDSSSPSSTPKRQSEEPAKSQAQKENLHKGKNIKLEAGQSRQFSLQVNQQTCIDGYFKDKTQKFLISSYIDEKDKLSSLNFSVKVSGKTLEYTIEIIQNIMTLSVPSLNNYYISKAIPYSLCITTNSSDSFWVSFMQTEDFSLLPSEVDTVVREQYTFVTHTQAPLIVDIFQCRGKSNIVYNENRQKLKQNEAHHLDIIGIQNQPHAVRINTFSTTFYKINAPLAIMRWFPLIIEKGIGTGYLDYGIGKLRYESGVFGITLIWQSLLKERQTNSSIASLDFTLYISSSSSDLQSGSQCQTFLESDTWQIRNVIDEMSAKELNKTFSYTFNKGQLVDRFGQNVTLFSTIVIDLFLRPLGEQDQENDGQRYRFIYPQVQIPGQIVSKGYIASLTFTQILLVALVAFIAFIIFVYFLLRKILPLLGILKNRYLVEENEQQGAEPVENKVVSEAQNDLIVPPSSERQGVEKFNSMMNQYEEQENN